MGLLVDVFKTGSSDCTNSGLSSNVSGLCLVNVSGPFDPSANYPSAILETHVKGCLRIVPENDGKKWFMNGGNFAATSDSRFGEACEKLLGHRFYGAVAIHDRVE